MSRDTVDIAKEESKLRPFSNILALRISSIEKRLNQLAEFGVLDKNKNKKETYYSGTIPFGKYYVYFGVSIKEWDEWWNNTYGLTLHPSISNTDHYGILNNGKWVINVFRWLHAITAFNDSGKWEKVELIFHDINRKKVLLDKYEEHKDLVGLGLHTEVTTPTQAIENIEKTLIYIEKTWSYKSEKKKDIKETLESTRNMWSQ